MTAYYTCIIVRPEVVLDILKNFEPDPYAVMERIRKQLADIKEVDPLVAEREKYKVVQEYAIAYGRQKESEGYYKRAIMDDIFFPLTKINYHTAKIKVEK